MTRLGALAAVLGVMLTGGVSAVRAATAYAVSQKNLVVFQTGVPSGIMQSTEITGLGVGESVVGIDLRPADQKLYLVTVDGSQTGRLYTLNPSSAAATFVAILSQPLNGSFWGMDFSPVTDRIRLVSDSFQNLRVNPVTGEVTVDSAISYSPGDPGQGSFPALFAIAYTNNFTGAASTTLYGIDVGTDALVRSDSPNSGLLSTVGSLGVDAAGVEAFDIAPSPVNHGYALLSVGGSLRLYQIDLATGHASEVGPSGIGMPVDAFSIGPDYPHTAFSRQQTVRAVSSGTGYQELNFNYTTGELSVSPYQDTSTSVPRFFPFAEWTGVFHYDYAAGAFTQALYTRQHSL